MFNQCTQKHWLVITHHICLHINYYNIIGPIMAYTNILIYDEYIFIFF